MKILFCDNSLRELIRFREPIIEAYLKNGNDVVTLAPKNIDIPDYSNYPGTYNHINIELNRGGMNPFADMIYFFKLWRTYITVNPDYIFHYTIKPNIYGTLAAWLAGKKSSAIIAGLGYTFNTDSFGSRIARRLYKFSLRFCDKVIVLNQSNYDVIIENRISNSEKLILLNGGEGLDISKYTLS